MIRGARPETWHQLPRGTPAGTTITYAFDKTSSSDPYTINAVSFVPDNDVAESRCTVRQESPLPDFQLHGGPALYKAIEIAWINPSAIHDATVGFSVTKAWLDENHVDPSNVVLMRQHDFNWAGLPTTFDRQDGDRYYYTATTPGFSFFAVTDKTTADAATVTAAEQPVVSEENEPDTVPQDADAVTPVPIKAKAPVQQAVAVTGPKAAAPAGTGPVPGFSLLWIAVAALISMLGVAGFFVGRRMWWKHQNPALFEDYD